MEGLQKNIVLLFNLKQTGRDLQKVSGAAELVETQEIYVTVPCQRYTNNGKNHFILPN